MNKTKANGKNIMTTATGKNIEIKSNKSKNCNGRKMVLKLIQTGVITGVITRVTQIRIIINGRTLVNCKNGTVK